MPIFVVKRMLAVYGRYYVLEGIDVRPDLRQLD